MSMQPWEVQYEQGRDVDRLRKEIERLTRDVSFWKAERDAAVNHAVTYGPEIERLRAPLRAVYGDLQHYVAHGPGSVDLTARLFEIGRLLRDYEQKEDGK